MGGANLAPLIFHTPSPLKEYLVTAEPQAVETETQDETPSEKEVLMNRARLMGITFSNNISVDKLREKIAAKLNDEAEQEDAEPEAASDVDAPVSRDDLIKASTRLVRIRIACLNPAKKDLPGEIFTVANDYIGTIRKFVPYGEATDDGYHVPYCIFQMLEEKRFLNIRTVKDRRTGTNRVEQKWVKEFAIEVLPQLTQKELDQLAQAQIAAGSVDTSASDDYLA